MCHLTPFNVERKKTYVTDNPPIVMITEKNRVNIQLIIKLFSIIIYDSYMIRNKNVNNDNDHQTSS